MISSAYALHVPLALIDWARRDTSAREFAEELLVLGSRQGDDIEIPDASAWSRLWCCIEAIVYAAVGAQRADLLVGLPTHVAKELGLKFAWHAADGTCYELGGDGRGRSTSWGGAEALLGWSQGDPAALRAVREAMDIVGVKLQHMVEVKPCCKCEKMTAVSVETTDGTIYCSACWSYLTTSATVSVPAKVPSSRRHPNERSRITRNKLF